MTMTQSSGKKKINGMVPASIWVKQLDDMIEKSERLPFNDLCDLVKAIQKDAIDAVVNIQYPYDDY
jgi:hypothetical protein